MPIAKEFSNLKHVERPQILKKISIITATYNSEAHISELIRHLRQQTNKNFEWVVADGASTDATLSLIRGATDLNLVIDSRPDHGIYDAMNRALEIANGDYYMVLGSDDVLYPDAVKQMHQALRESHMPDVVVFGVDFGAQRRTAYWRTDRGWLGASHVVTAHSVGMLICKSLHKKVGDYSLLFPVAADALFIKKITAVPSIKVVLSEHIAGRFSLGGASNSGTARGLCEGYLIQLSTERSVLLQTIVFGLRLLKNLGRIRRENQC
jgi:glycosyltransferase involved in cell wall biosynthesis